jgi:hypothetical protein
MSFSLFSALQFAFVSCYLQLPYAVKRFERSVAVERLEQLELTLDGSGE